MPRYSSAPDEVSPPDALDDMAPDEEHFHEATGNEGASFDRTYSRAALVVWPSNRILAVLNQGGLEATLPFLEELVGKWQAAGAKEGLPHKRQAEELAGHMIATWTVSTWHERDRSEPSDFGRMLSLLARLGNPALLTRMLEKLMSRQGHDKADNPAILEALAQFEPDVAAGWLQKLMAAKSLGALGACAALLAGALEGAFAKTPTQLLGAAQALVDQLPGDPASAPKDQWGRPRGGRPDAPFTVHLVDVVDRVDVRLANKAIAHVLAWPRHFDLDHVLVPAAKRLIQSKRRSRPACDAVYKAAVAHLETRIAEPLEAPVDWTRPSGIGCRCQHCRELSEFLADNARESWTLRAAQQVRTHVEDQIRRASADVDTETLRRGSPHSLICRKNQASYMRRVAQRKQDLADLAALRR